MNYQGPPGSQRGIEWLQPPNGTRGYTWNPVTGCTNDFCEVRLICWAREQAMRHGDGAFRPRLHAERLPQPLHHRAPALIAAVLSGDLFSEGVPYDWIMGVFDVMERAPQHVFMVLTKNPQRLLQTLSLLRYPNVWVGTSVTGPEHAERIRWLRRTQAHHVFLSIEPFRHPFTPKQCETLFWSKSTWRTRIEWIVVVGQSRPWVHPDRAWIDDLIAQANVHNTPLLVKRNAHYYAGSLGMQPVAQWPRAILEHLAPKVKP